MALLGGNLYCNLEKTTNGDGTEGNPYKPEQLSALLTAATGLSFYTTIFLEGTKVLSAGEVLDFSTPLLTVGFPGPLTLTFKKKPGTSRCPTIYAEDGLHTERFLLKLGGGSFKTYFADVLVHVRGSLNNSLECLIEVVGDNRVFMSNNGLVGNNLSDFISGGSCCGCGGGGSGAAFSFLKELSFVAGIVKVVEGDTHAYVILDNSRIAVVDISNPDNPVIVQPAVDVFTSINDILVFNGYLYIASGDSLKSYTEASIIEDFPSITNSVNSFDVGYNITLLTRYNNTIFAFQRQDNSADNGRVQSYNVSSGMFGAPVINVSVDNAPISISLLENSNAFIAYIRQNAFGDKNLCIFDFNLGTTVGSSGTLSSFSDMTTITSRNTLTGDVDATKVYVTTTDNGIRILVWNVGEDGSINSSADSSNLYSHGPDFAHSITIDDRKLFIASDGKVVLFDLLDNVLTPVIVDELTTSDSFTDVSIIQHKAYIETNNGELHVYNIDINAAGGGGGCCCCSSAGGFSPILVNNLNLSLYENTMVIHSAEAEVLDTPSDEKILAMVNNMVILGNVAYTFLFPTTTVTKVDKNFLFKIASTAVSVIDTYETSVVNPEGLPDVGDFSGVHPLVNVLGNRFTLNLRYGPNGAGNGIDSIPVPSAMDGNYQGFSLFSDSDAGYAPCGTQTSGDVVTVIDGEEVLSLANIVDADDPRRVYTLLVNAAGQLLMRREGNPQNTDAQIGSDSIPD